MIPVAICTQNWRSTSRQSEGAPGERIASLPVNCFIHPAGRPINTSWLKVLRRPVESAQYCSGELQGTLKDWGMRSSMGRKGNCWDNAPTESFWGRLKTANVHGHKLATSEQARQAVMDWMAFYNHRTLHSSLGYLSPMQFEQHWYEAQRKMAA